MLIISAWHAANADGGMIPYSVENDIRRGAVNGEAYAVNVSTFTTRCMNVKFPDDTKWTLPRNPSCVWYPNGTVWRGCNESEMDKNGGQDIGVINSIRGGMVIEYVEYLPPYPQTMYVEWTKGLIIGMSNSFIASIVF